MIVAIHSTSASSVERVKRLSTLDRVAEKAGEVGDRLLLEIDLPRGSTPGIDRQRVHRLRLGGRELEDRADSGDHLCLPCVLLAAGFGDAVLERRETR